MTDTEDRFYKIYQEMFIIALRQAPGGNRHQWLVDTLSGYERKQLEEFEAVPEYGVWKYMQLIHNTQGPAFENLYYLFNYKFTQSEWFKILGYSEEEKTVHCLKWGKYD